MQRSNPIYNANVPSIGFASREQFSRVMLVVVTYETKILSPIVNTRFRDDRKRSIPANRVATVREFRLDSHSVSFEHRHRDISTRRSVIVLSSKLVSRENETRHGNFHFRVTKASRVLENGVGSDLYLE